MFTARQKGIFLLFSITQIVVISAMYWMLFYVFNHLRFTGGNPPENYMYAWIVILSSFGIEIASRSNHNYALSSLAKDRLKAICHRQALFPLAFLLGFLVINKSDAISRVFLITFFTFYLCWIFWSNLAGFKQLVKFLYNSHQKGLFPTLLVGSSKALKRYVDHPDRPAPPGTKIVGVVPTDPEAAEALDLTIDGDIFELTNICKQHSVKAIHCLGANDDKELNTLINEISNDLGIRAIWLENVEERYGRGSVAGNAANYSIIAPSREPLEDPVNRLFKRSFDIVFAILGVVFILPPAMLFVGLIHRRHSPGPLFYRQNRSGRHGEVFQVTKFRSMRVSDDDKFVQAKDGDSRIFPGGDLIRKYSIDELPQLLNVLTGHMSIVGPRPHPLKLDEDLAPDTQAYRVRNQAKPGITGLAQSRGWRGETSEPRQIANRVKMDLFYIRNWSLFFDIRIIVETVWQLILPPKTAR